MSMGSMNCTGVRALLSLSSPKAKLFRPAGKTALAYYSTNSKNFDDFFKVVKSKVRIEDEGNSLGVECGPNWELLAPRGNRFYLPRAIGPAWQGLTTTLTLQQPLETLVDFGGKTKKADKENAKLKFSVGACPSLIKKSLQELFPAPEVVSSERLSLLTLRYSGDDEKGARKFVMAACEITARLRLHGFWADFMNPFSGKPFYSWANGKNLYKVDDRFRGINMKLHTTNNCTVISTEDKECFSGAIYTNAPSDFSMLKSILNDKI